MSLEKMSSTLEGPVTSGVLPVNMAAAPNGLVPGESAESTSETMAGLHSHKEANQRRMSTLQIEGDICCTTAGSRSPDL